MNNYVKYNLVHTFRIHCYIIIRLYNNNNGLYNNNNGLSGVVVCSFGSHPDGPGSILTMVIELFLWERNIKLLSPVHPAVMGTWDSSQGHGRFPIEVRFVSWGWSACRLKYLSDQSWRGFIPGDIVSKAAHTGKYNI